MIQRIKFLCILSSIIAGFLIFSHQTSAYIDCTDGQDIRCDSPGQTDDPGLGSGTAGPQNTFSTFAEFSCDAFGNAFTGQGSVVDCIRGYNMAGLGQVYKITYDPVRNDNPPVKVYWCINNTGLWDNTGACGTVQENGQNNDPTPLWINDYPGNIQQYRYMVIHARAEATATNDNNFTGIFTMYRRVVAMEPFTANDPSINTGSRPVFNFRTYNATPNVELYVRMSGPDGGDFQLTQCDTSVPDCSDTNWTLPMALTIPGTYTFTLHAGGPSENASDNGFKRIESSPVTVTVSDVPIPTGTVCINSNVSTHVDTVNTTVQQTFSDDVFANTLVCHLEASLGSYTATGIRPGGYADATYAPSQTQSLTANGQTITFNLNFTSGGTVTPTPTPTYEITFTINGMGTVTDTINGGSCTSSSPSGNSCTVSNIPEGTYVSISPGSVNGSVFSSWGQDCVGQSNTGPCSGVVTQNYKATANFSGPTTCSGPSSQSCTSPQNSCGQTTTGTQNRTCTSGAWSSWGTCSATTPSDSSCTSPTPTGTITCNGSGSTNITSGGAVNVVWSSQNATQCGVWPFSYSSPWVGASGGATDNPTETRTYKLDCWNNTTPSNFIAQCTANVVAQSPAGTGTVQINIYKDGVVCVPCAHRTVFPNGTVNGWNGPHTWSPAPTGNYNIDPYPLDGYTVAVNPPYAQTLLDGQTITFSISYSPVGSGGGTTPATASCNVNVSYPQPNNPSSLTITEPNYCVSGPAATVGWTYSDPAGSPQSAYQVQIDEQGSFNSPEVDSGKVNSGSVSYFTGQGLLQFNTTYRARVRVWNGFDIASDWTTSGTWKTPQNAYPQVDFNWTANGVLNNPSPSLNQPIAFTDQTIFNGNPNGRQWSWLFGDGGTSTTQNPSKTYTAEGSYYVTLTATDNANQSCIRTKGPLIIQKPIPKWREVAPK